MAVAAPNQAAADAGARLAARGGNAVDAALAATLVTCVNEPGMVTLGGGAFVTVAVPGRRAVTVDGYVEMPGRGLPPEAFGRGTTELFTHYGGGTAMTIGAGSVATPGLLAAVEEAHRRYGGLPWPAVVEPAAEVARQGFVLSTPCDYFFAHVREDVFGHDPATRAALYHADGRPVRAGESMVIPDLADFLDRVRAEGAAALTIGPAADALVELMVSGGGLITHADLAGYAAVVRPAAPIEVGSGWTFLTNPPPAIGGPVLAALLVLLEAGAAEPAEPWPSLLDLVRVTRAVLAFRASDLDVGEDLVTAGQGLLDAVRREGLRWVGSPSTAHVSAVDDLGAACAVTASCGYGSGITVPGTGVWLNNCLGEHELNVAGLHALAPGRRLASNMAPTVARRRDGTVLAIGSPGADRITTALAQVISRLCRHSRTGAPLDGEVLRAAIAAPRLHISRDLGGGEVLHHEADLSVAALDAPAARAEFGGLTRREHHAASMYFGGVAAALRCVDGTLVAAADPRRDGATALV